MTYLLTGPVRKFAIVAGAMPEIRARDVHREPTPRLGGIAMFFGLCAGLLVADHLKNLNAVFSNSNEPRALLSGAALIWLIGVLDDKFEIDALIKLGGQMIAAGVMVMQGLTILWLPIPGVGLVALTQWQGTLLTVALVVITINAVNFVDGLDGLAAGDGVHRGRRVLPVRLPDLVLVRHRGRGPGDAVRGGPDGYVPGLSAAQHASGADLHGRLRLDAHRAGALQPARSPSQGRSTPTR